MADASRGWCQTRALLEGTTAAEASGHCPKNCLGAASDHPGKLQCWGLHRIYPAEEAAAWGTSCSPGCCNSTAGSEGAVQGPGLCQLPLAFTRDVAEPHQTISCCFSSKALGCPLPLQFLNKAKAQNKPAFIFFRVLGAKTLLGQGQLASWEMLVTHG